MRHANRALRIIAMVLAALFGAGCPVAMGAPVNPSFDRPGENIARGKSYTVEPRPNYRHCTDPADAKQLTDGQYSAGYFWTQKTTVGWSGARPVIITVDLGKVEPICGASYNTAAGVAGVQWPQAVFVLVSNDGKTFHEAGDLVALGAPNGVPPEAGYGVHRYWTGALRTRGRYVVFVISGLPYVFTDEIEIYRGDPASVNLPLPGEASTDPKAFFRKAAIGQAIAKRLRDDVRAIREVLDAAQLAGPEKQRIAAELSALEQELPAMPREFGDDFRTVLPLNPLHRRAFRAQAGIWRAVGVPPLMPWQSGLWDPLSHVGIPAREAGTAIHVAMMQNEYRAAAFNLSNATDGDLSLQLRIAGLPGGVNPRYVAVHEVAWTDTNSGQPVAAALPKAKRDGDAFDIDVPSGLTRQVWLTLHPVDVPPGTHKGKIVLTGPEVASEVAITLRLYPMRFPDRPTLHLGGWDYTDADRRYEITPENREQVIAHLREHFVDSPWGTSAVLPKGKYDSKGNLGQEPDTSRFDEWLRRWPGARQYCVFASVSDRFGDARMGTPAFEQRVMTWIRFWARHAKRRGLRPEQLAVLLVDEPRTPEQDEIILEWARAIRAAGTGVRIWEDPTHQDPGEANQQMMAACHVLCPNRPRFLTNARYRQYFAERRPAGTELAFYSCSGPVRLLDPYTYHRLQAWSCWRYGARAGYFWAFGDSGGASSWNEYAAQRNAYVPFFLDGASATAGKHMEAIREGVEDYEYLVMLRERIAEAEQRGVEARTLDRARQLLAGAADRVCGAQDTDALRWLEPKDRTLADRVRIEILETLAQLPRPR